MVVLLLFNPCCSSFWSFAWSLGKKHATAYLLVFMQRTRARLRMESRFQIFYIRSRRPSIVLSIYNLHKPLQPGVVSLKQPPNPTSKPV
jgi:hypothetical protein